MPRISVLVPTYRRLTDLARCLDALERQDRPAHEIVVVVRDTDSESYAYLLSRRCAGLLKIVIVTESGVVAAMNRGLSVASGDIIALTDDDAAPHGDWLAKIDAHFASDGRIGGVGGRDYLYQGDDLQDGASSAVGVLQWFGRVIGAHHIGTGPARDVDVLKGVNCAYRADVLRELGFDQRLLGEGAQVHWELALGLAIRRSGYRLIYDPTVKVDHYPSIRHDSDKRTNNEGDVLFNAVYNETLAVWEHLPIWRRAAFLMWSAAIGTKIAPGVSIAIYLLMNGKPRVSQRMMVTARARLRAICGNAHTSAPPAKREGQTPLLG